MAQDNRVFRFVRARQLPGKSESDTVPACTTEPLQVRSSWVDTLGVIYLVAELAALSVVGFVTLPTRRRRSGHDGVPETSDTGFTDLECLWRRRGIGRHVEVSAADRKSRRVHVWRASDHVPGDSTCGAKGGAVIGRHERVNPRQFGVPSVASGRVSACWNYTEFYRRALRQYRRRCGSPTEDSKCRSKGGFSSLAHCSLPS